MQFVCPCVSQGFQVAPAELERVLLTHPMIVDAAVIGVPDEREGELPRAYVVRREGSQLSEDDVADFMSERVSDVLSVFEEEDCHACMPACMSQLAIPLVHVSSSFSVAVDSY